MRNSEIYKYLLIPKVLKEEKHCSANYERRLAIQEHVLLHADAKLNYESQETA